MSLRSRKEYVSVMRVRYGKACTRAEKIAILDEVVQTCDYHRKYAVRVLQRREAGQRPPVRMRRRTQRYTDALPAIQLAWEALDYPCAERLHPVLWAVVAQLVAHGELSISAHARDQLAAISRATLARRLADLPSPKARRTVPRPKPGSLLREVPIDRYAWDEARPGALEIDLVEHNGGSSHGHFAYTLSMVDVVTGWSTRRAFLGRSQKAVFAALEYLLADCPFRPWALHSDNGSEFLSDHLLRFVRSHSLQFSRSRPYHKNDNAHVEQRNRQFVREVVGYGRFDTPEQIVWLNAIYGCLDPYANLFLPTRKLIAKTRDGAHVRKRYDTAATPFDRLCVLQAIDPDLELALRQRISTLNPLALHRQLENLLVNTPAKHEPVLDSAAD